MDNCDESRDKYEEMMQAKFAEVHGSYSQLETLSHYSRILSPSSFLKRLRESIKNQNDLELINDPLIRQNIQNSSNIYQNTQNYINTNRYPQNYTNTYQNTQSSRNTFQNTQNSTNTLQNTQNSRNTFQNTQNSTNTLQNTQNSTNTLQNTQNSTDTFQNTQNSSNTYHDSHNLTNSCQNTQDSTSNENCQNAQIFSYTQIDKNKNIDGLRVLCKMSKLSINSPKLIWPQDQNSNKNQREKNIFSNPNFRKHCPTILSPPPHLNSSSGGSITLSTSFSLSMSDEDDSGYEKSSSKPISNFKKICTLKAPLNYSSTSSNPKIKSSSTNKKMPKFQLYTSKNYKSLFFQMKEEKIKNLTRINRPAISMKRKKISKIRKKVVDSLKKNKDRKMVSTGVQAYFSSELTLNMTRRLTNFTHHHDENSSLTNDRTSTCTMNSHNLNNIRNCECPCFCKEINVEEEMRARNILRPILPPIHPNLNTTQTID